MSIYSDRITAIYRQYILVYYKKEEIGVAVLDMELIIFTP